MGKGQTPSQTVGPFFSYGLTPQQYKYQSLGPGDHNLLVDGVEGDRIQIVGCVFDGNGEAVDDAMVEIWQADAAGVYPGGEGSNSPFTGFGRVGTGTDAKRQFMFDTIKPGPVEDGHAPHINVTLFMRGLLLHTFTRIYFSDEEDANASDPVLSVIAEDRRDTLIAKRQDSSGMPVYRFDVHMQGDHETVFFDV